MEISPNSEVPPVKVIICTVKDTRFATVAQILGTVPILMVSGLRLHHAIAPEIPVLLPAIQPMGGCV